MHTSITVAVFTGLGWLLGYYMHMAMFGGRK